MLADSMKSPASFIGSHATYTTMGRTYLGTIKDIIWDHECLKRVVCQHFNGDMWDIQPPFSLIEVLERTYEPKGE